MITALIIWLVNKYILKSKTRVRNRYSLRVFARSTSVTLFFILLLAQIAVAGQGTMRYNIFYKGTNVGRMYLTQVMDGDNLEVKIVSNVNMRILMAISVNISEESFYTKEKLMYSKVYQEVNGKVKVNRQTRLAGAGYETMAEGRRRAMSNTAINYNVARLYNKEPVHVRQVYSDSFQQFLSLKAVGSHAYKLQLPDNHYNIYHYENGICSKVELHSRFYSIEMQLETK